MTAQSETPLTDISERLASASLRNAGFFSVGFCRVLDMQVLETALAESRAECERLREELNVEKTRSSILFMKSYAAIKIAAETREREAYERAAKVCEKVATEPSSLWEEPGCWSHAASNCAIHCRALSGERREG